MGRTRARIAPPGRRWSLRTSPGRPGTGRVDLAGRARHGAGPRGHPTWNVFLEYWGSAPGEHRAVAVRLQARGSARLVLVCGRRHADLLEATEDGGYVYTFTGGYQLTDGREPRMPLHGSLQVTLRFWADGTEPLLDRHHALRSLIIRTAVRPQQSNLRERDVCIDGSVGSDIWSWFVIVKGGSRSGREAPRRPQIRTTLVD